MEQQEVQRQFDQMLPWDKREFIMNNSSLIAGSMTDTEILNFFGVEKLSPNAMVEDAWDAVALFGADDILSSIDDDDVIEYIGGNHRLLNAIKEEFSLTEALA